MSYEIRRQFAMSTSHTKNFFYGKYGVGKLKDAFIPIDIAHLALTESSRAEMKLKERVEKGYLYKEIPKPTLFSLAKATAATGVLVESDPGLTFAKDCRFFLTADDWVWGKGPSEDIITDIIEKPSGVETIMDYVSPQDHLFSVFGVTDVLIEYPSQSISIMTWVITSYLGNINNTQVILRNASNIAGGLDIIQAIELGLIPPKEIYTIKAESFEPMTLQEAENVLREEKNLKPLKKYEKKFYLNDIVPTHPMFDRYLRGALMDIHNN